MTEPGDEVDLELDLGLDEKVLRGYGRGNISLDLCPDETVLRAYARGKISSGRILEVVKSHLQFCPFCRQQRKRMEPNGSRDNSNPELLAQRLMKRREELARGQEEGPVPGSIWRAIAESDKDAYGPLLMVLHVDEPSPDGTVRVAEVSEQINQAIETDYVLEPRESGLWFLCMVRGGNWFSTQKSSLKTFAGRLPELLAKQVIDFCSSAESVNDSVPLSQIEFLQDAHGNRLMRRRGITSGLLVTDEDDPRLGFLEQSKARTAYLSKASMEPLSEKVVRIDRKKNVKWFVKRILPLAAMIAVVVVGGKVFFQSEDKPALEDLPGVGLPSRPVVHRLEIRNPLDPASSREVFAPIEYPVDAGVNAGPWLINRTSSRMRLKPTYYLTSPYHPFSELFYAFFPVKHLLTADSYSIDWTCESILVPPRSKDDRSVYDLALQSLISLALDKSPKEMSYTYTKATARWVLRYCRGSYLLSSGLKDSEIMVKDFKENYEALYGWLAQSVEGEKQSDHKLDYWDRLITDIVTEVLQNSFTRFGSGSRDE